MAKSKSSQGTKRAKEVKYVPLSGKAYEMNIEHLAEGKLGSGFGGAAEIGVSIDTLLKREARP